MSQNYQSSTKKATYDFMIPSAVATQVKLVVTTGGFRGGNEGAMAPPPLSSTTITTILL